MSAMPRQLRSRLPALWLMTDERLGDRLVPAIAALPRGSGIVFRHYGLDAEPRRALLARVAAAARRHGHRLVVAEPPPGMRVSGVHLPSRTRRLPLPRPRLLTVAVHSLAERARAGAMRADLLFVSPVFRTASHPAARPLGVPGLARLAARAPAPVIALGGMTAARFRRLRAAVPLHGYAAISSLGGGRCDQKASAPPR
jgi:thiamine-phosphate pyrophosphorylase